jgi:hypothetical protein
MGNGVAGWIGGNISGNPEIPKCESMKEGGDVRCVRWACFVYIGLFPERLDDPGAVFAPVLRGVVFVARGVAGPPERRLICFVRAMLIEDVDVQDERGKAQSAPAPKIVAER